MLLCIGLNLECWTETDDLHRHDRVFRNVTTLDECKAACANDYTCIAIDWNPNNTEKACWIETSTVVKDPPVLEQTEITTHYKLKRVCLLS